ncbi:uncharacterized protein HMPREF1541_07481 [Cyphellophora europaea CBS 101466]|uniref:Mog1p/PsbP-like protein n=1 Tax=Cyphellophora europaea (strain CBS 101466) TaxID=1220924 RepID=W2RQ79_CYPE1|nr:uncharacterized protein HMPREF1541_07481 [Cyphellophora europaea CBS 101466]ETN37858.1 hypothetical protein HMPREF1541_07481 [Cyphellophora europaea CBS 101466]
MADFGTRELYGGAITVELPTTLIDASDIRQIPDHQEVFLSNKTLTSIIFEINQFVKQPDPAALYFHFTDVIAPPDHLAEELGAPTKLSLAEDSLKDFPAYLVQGGIISPEVDKKASTSLPIEWQQTPLTTNQLTKCYQLVVRMDKYSTDFCVRVNVPLKELSGKEEADAEEAVAKGIMEKIVATLDIKEFGLFASD